ncbi:MbnP family copper-binding protein [Leptothrix discophora]|uniref:Metallo-mystery pair system four-Cys motif protein n=1 Tax=Leptothrix discophora TaxID=89 RepID=A0ABT9FZJ1_LEPDI|nr:MbnP family copper-binding protein [Leptothrix discophora]MDP4299576.1 metallo-mystery pair system four-Cys motif protein [Leptothrix discophora]
MNTCLNLTSPRAVRRALSTLALAALAACGGGGDTPATTQPVSIEFAAVNGLANTPVSCATVLTGMGSGSVKAKLADLRFYVSDVKLVNAAGQEVAVTLTANEWQLTQAGHGLTLIDLENDADTCAGDAATNVRVTGTAPAGTYTGVRFTLGVPSALNHLDATAATTLAPLTNNDMFWSWTGGYKHAKIELNPENATTPDVYTGGMTNTSVTPSTSSNTFNFHLGDTSCTAGVPLSSSTCLSENTSTITLATFNAGTQKVALDLGALFARSNLRVESGGAPGCMSGPTDPQCQEMWSVLDKSFSLVGGVITATSLSADDAGLTALRRGTTVFRPIAK